MPTIFDQDLPRNEANFAPLSPLSFIERTAEIYPQRLAVVHGDLRRSWSQLYSRSRQLASALVRHGIRKGDTVAVMLPNTPPMVEAHFGIPMAGAVLNAINTRLDPATVAFMLDHGEAKVVIVDPEFAPVMAQALAQRQGSHPLLVIDVEDALYTGPLQPVGSIGYEAFLAQGDAGFDWQMPGDEWDAIALNYTSGTTGNPKGVVYHHRGAAVNAISNILEWDMPKHAVYLWTLPMFHCNGWCFPWTIAARAGVNVCLRRVEAQAMIDAIRTHGVTHYCGAPIVHSLLVNAPEAMKQGLPQRRQGDGRRGRSSGIHDRGHGAARLRAHPRLRPDRGLWSGHRLPETRRMGAARHRRAGPLERAPGRALSPAARCPRAGSADHATRAHGTVKPWARSCSAAIS